MTTFDAILSRADLRTYLRAQYPSLTAGVTYSGDACPLACAANAIAPSPAGGWFIGGGLASVGGNDYPLADWHEQIIDMVDDGTRGRPVSVRAVLAMLDQIDAEGMA